MDAIHTHQFFDWPWSTGQLSEHDILKPGRIPAEEQSPPPSTKVFDITEVVYSTAAAGPGL